MTLDQALFPELHVYRLSDIAAKDPVEVLRRWVNGGQFHRYSGEVHLHPDYDPTIEALLDYHGVLSSGRLSWSLNVRQYGTGRDGWCAGHSTTESAAYTVLSMIEQDERSDFEQSLVVGIA